MRRSLLVTAVTALALAAPAAAGLPQAGALVPGTVARRHPARGVSAGRPRRARHVLRDVPRLSRNGRGTSRTRRSTRHGLAVEFSGGKVSGVYTLWRPRGLARGAQARLRRVACSRCTTCTGASHTVTCAGYDALVRDSARGARRTTSTTAGSGASASSGAAARPADEHRPRGRRAGRAAPGRSRAPHAGRHVAHARRAGRRARPRQGGVLPARRRLQVPRRVQQDLVARRGRAAPRRASPTRPATTRRRSPSPRRCSARARRSSCPRTRRPRSSTRRAVTAPRSCRTTAGRRAARRSAPRLAEERGLALVPPYDDPLVMAGQGTVALELLADVARARRAARAGQRRRPDRRLRDRREGAAARDPRGRRRAGDRRRHAAVARRRRARAHRRPARRSPTGCRRPSPAS